MSILYVKGLAEKSIMLKNKQITHYGAVLAELLQLYRDDQNAVLVPLLKKYTLYLIEHLNFESEWIPVLASLFGPDRRASVFLCYTTMYLSLSMLNIPSKQWLHPFTESEAI